MFFFTIRSGGTIQQVYPGDLSFPDRHSGLSKVCRAWCNSRSIQVGINFFLEDPIFYHICVVVALFLFCNVFLIFLGMTELAGE